MENKDAATEKVAGAASQPTATGAEVALHGIYEVAKLLAEGGRLEVTLARVLRVLSSFLDMGSGLVVLLGAGGAPVLAVGAGFRKVPGHDWPDMPTRAIARIVKTRMPLVVADKREDPLFQGGDDPSFKPMDAEAHSAPALGPEVTFIGVPIRDRGRVVGTVSVERQRGPGPYVSWDHDVRILTMVANVVAPSIRIHRLTALDATLGRPQPAPPEGARENGHTPRPSSGARDRERLIEAMQSAGWVQAKAARLLGVSARQIGYALRKHEIPIKKF